MIRPSLRIASALAGLLIISAVASNPIHSLGIIVTLIGTLLLMPLFASWRSPSAEDYEWLEEWVGRLRNAMVVCYGTALWIYLMVLSSQHARTDALQRLASLGAAFWTVGFVAMFFTAYFASRKSALVREMSRE